MIFGHITHSRELIANLPVSLQQAVRHLQETDFRSLAAGSYELQGRDIYVQVNDTKTKEDASARPEVHRQYVDVQFSLDGKEKMGFAVDSGDHAVAQDLLAEKDVLFYEPLAEESFVEMTPGTFAIFFPEDIHRPNIRVGESAAIRKVIIKVRASLLK